MVWVLYAVVKYVAYSAWCYAGLKAMRSWPKPPILPALRFGMVRMLLGIGFGVAIFYLANLVWQFTVGLRLAEPLTYILAYVPTRWLEWSIMAGLMGWAGGQRAFLLGGGSRDRLWRAGGIGISCVADVPILLLTPGLPVGLFMC